MLQTRDRGTALESRDTMSDLKIQGQDLTEMSSLIQSTVVMEVTKQVQALLTSLETTTLNIAITGESGTGKSTFINAIRGLSDEDVGAAVTGVTESTREPNCYQHPKISTVQLWDLPGIGTPSFQADRYLEQVGFERYDFFIILSSERFRENNAYLARSIRAVNKKFYFVRSKIDLDIRACQRNRNFNEERVLAEIRANCIHCLEKEGVEAPKVFLLSSFELHKYDFHKLQDTLVQELNGQKKHVLLLSLPNITVEMIEKKKESLKRHIWKKALLACLISALPTFPVHYNAPLLMETLASYQKNFGLDDESISTLALRVNKSPCSLKKQITSSLGKDISDHSVQSALRMAALCGHASVSLVERHVPLLGNLVAGGISFVAIYILLSSSLDSFAQDAQKVLKAAYRTEKEDKLEAYYSQEIDFLYD
ncbi:interferon-inducible GTPase 5 isoform X2 [Microcaecilia unicolor]|uniref:Interferon-inducible GTPase 5-like isoform X2 n=1 Tax=Microcaecilia unicolor TaxID=1415580 RepID=A0A6P7YVB5_9AMPH|nr:interferon-inducible GTPase 5-like isoform X2 [Microcaecilia unicolor]